MQNIVNFIVCIIHPQWQRADYVHSMALHQHTLTLKNQRLGQVHIDNLEDHTIPASQSSLIDVSVPIPIKEHFTYGRSLDQL